MTEATKELLEKKQYVHRWDRHFTIKPSEDGGEKEVGGGHSY
jgi:hypothetical protein